jgi:hypothetical protein
MLAHPTAIIMLPAKIRHFNIPIHRSFVFSIISYLPFGFNDIRIKFKGSAE